MWKSLFKQIWNQRNSNLWVWSELLIVIILLWYGVDLVYNYEASALQPKGYDTENVFDVTVRIKPTLLHDSILMNESSGYMRQIYNLVSQYPGVEQACYYFGSVPYTGNDVYEGYAPHSDSTHVTNCYIRYVSSSYFKVFHLKPVIGKLDIARWKATEYPMPALMSITLSDSVFHTVNSIGKTCFNPYFIGSNTPETNYKVMAILSEHKLDDYQRYEPFVYLPASENMGWWYRFALRVSPDKIEGFGNRFLRDMQLKLAIGPFYLDDVHSYSDMKATFDIEQGTVNYLNSTYAVIAFFVFNIFLTILGTFWFRTRKRKSEIALRMALGSTRLSIFNYYMMEGILLLLLAALPAFIVCINMQIADLTVHTLMDPTVGRFIFCFILALVILLCIISLSVWFPAFKAMKIQPAEALHEG